MSDHLRTYFNGAVTKLRGAFEQTMSMASANKGIARERAVSLLFEDALPASCSATSGEIVDGNGEASGQLDGIIIHHTGQALSTGGAGPRIVLIEGVMAALEVKSNLSSQWAEVMATARSLLKLKRAREMDGVLGKLHRSSSSGDGPRVPFCVVGYEGWKTKEKLTEHGNELLDLVDKSDWPWGAFVVQLEPSGMHFGRFWPNADPVTGTMCCDEENRGAPLYMLWLFLTSMAQTHVPRHANWNDYRYGFVPSPNESSEAPLRQPDLDAGSCEPNDNDTEGTN